MRCNLFQQLASWGLCHASAQQLHVRFPVCRYGDLEAVEDFIAIGKVGRDGEQIDRQEHIRQS